MRAAFAWGNIPVPYTAMWSDEVEAREPKVVRVRGSGLPRRALFLDDGVFKMTGKPIFTRLHQGRQRKVVFETRCQMCCRHLPERFISMNQGETDGGRPLINDGLPMCPGCAIEAFDACPGLQRHCAAGRTRIWLSPRHAVGIAPVLLGEVPADAGGNERVNSLIRKHGTIWTGPKLILWDFLRIELSELRGMAQAGAAWS